MKSSLRILAALLVWGLPRLLAAQLLDPAFRVSEVYKSGSVRQVVEQPDGKRLVLGVCVRVAHQQAPPTGLVRLLTNSNQPDPVFMRNIAALTGWVRQFLLLANGKILISGPNSPGPGFQSGAISRQALMLLNADGTPDPAFNAGNGPNAYIQHMVEQPDGKILLCGSFTQFSGYSVSCLVRLNPSGAMDTAFQLAVPVLQYPGTPSGYCMALQTDGKILVGGRLNGYLGGTAHYRGMVRLLATGQFDVSFRTGDSPSRLGSEVMSFAVQGDGKILVVEESGTVSRVMPTAGAPDVSFQTTNLGYYSYFDSYLVWGSPLIQLQPGTGRILVLSRGNAQRGTPCLLALTSSGAPDPTFNSASAVGYATCWVHATSTGQLLVGGEAQHFGAVNAPYSPLALLSAGGVRDSSLPVVSLQGLAAVSAMALQPDGKILVGGDFTEINGLALPGGFARLQADGIPDSLYSVTAGVDGRVNALAVQADGKVIVAGNFSTIGGSNARPALARLLPTGMLDVTFAPSFSLGISSGFGQLLLQPDGRLLVSSGATWAPGPISRNQNVVRLFANGTFDPSFQTTSYAPSNIILQPDGKIVAGGFMTNPNAVLSRWLPSGANDPSFAPLTYTTSNVPTVNLLAQDAAGRTYFNYRRNVTVAGSTTSVTSLVRALPDGTLDATYNYTPAIYMSVGTIQPNQRLLTNMGTLQSPSFATGTVRFLPSGIPDPSYQPLNGPDDGVNQLLIQPDGAILMAGQFTSVGGIVTNGIARLIDANVLTVAAKQLEIPTTAWPNPTHDVLHLSLSAVAHPQRVTLLDALGKAALTQPATQPEMTLNTTGLAPGLYLLRVDYASGPVTRRMVLE